MSTCLTLPNQYRLRKRAIRSRRITPVENYHSEIQGGQGHNASNSNKVQAASNKNKQPTPVARKDSGADKYQFTGSPLAFGDDENYRIEIKRKNSSNSIEALKRRLSDADMKVPKKATLALS